MDFLLMSASISLVLISQVVQLTQGACYTSQSDVTLKDHVIFSLLSADLNDCWQKCKNEARCQSLNFFIKQQLCEINNRTIQLAVNNTARKPYTTYFENPFRVAVGTVKEVPGISCSEILKTVGRVSGRYWLVDHARSSVPFMAYCNMTTVAIEECPVGQCKNGGTCNYFGSGKYQCACPQFTSGNDCEIKTCTNGQPLGMESKAIADAQITASSIYSSSYQPWYARLRGTSNGWCPNTHSAGQWIQIDFTSVKIITAVGTQGRYSGGEWPKKYSISHSSEGISFTPYESGKEFSANSDHSSIVRNEIVPHIHARFIRLVLPATSRWPTMRIEWYGCG